MSEFSGFVFDIDGTAVPHGALAVESLVLRGAFEALHEDVVAIAATGRSPDVALPITRALKLRYPSVIANGALLVDSTTGEIVWDRLLPKDTVAQVIRSCLPYNYPVELSGDESGSVLTAADQRGRERPVPVMFVKDIPLDVADDMQVRLLSIPDIHIYSSPAWGGSQDMVDLNVGHFEAKKSIALLELFGRYAIDGAQMIGVGDGINDVELFEVVGHRVAVENAHPQLIELADEIVPSQEQEGLAAVVRRFHRAA